MPNEAYEIVAPLDAKIDECDNEIGKIYKQDGKFWLVFKQLISKKGKNLDEIHSGNENEMKLPIKMPEFSFLRKEIL